MNYCPTCGTKLIDIAIDDNLIKKCNNCEFIDWNNWVYVSCVVVAYTKSNEFLMVKLKGKEEGKVTFPGGYRNIGETLEEAAKREFFEETGMILEEVKIRNTYVKDSIRLVWVVFTAMISNIKFIENDEVSELILIGNDVEIDSSMLRGDLTKQLYTELKQNQR